MTFIVDPRISSTCFILDDWPVSRVFLKNNANSPWLILVPRHMNVRDIDELPQTVQHMLMHEITALSSLVKTYFKPDKLNVGTLGNIVSQLHIHVVARFTTDALWPHGIWQAAQTTIPYQQLMIHAFLAELRSRVQAAVFIE